MNEKLYLILITGLPASGKTTIATHLVKDLSCQYIGKDQYKIELYDKYGFCSIEEKKILDAKSEEIMYSNLRSLLKQGKNVVLDKWICGDFSRIDSIAKATNAKVITIYLVCNADIATRRYNNRIINDSRHIGLSLKNKYPFVKDESKFNYALIEDMQKRSEFFKEKSFGDYRLEVSTNNIENDNNIYKQIKEFIVNIIKGIGY